MTAEEFLQKHEDYILPPIKFNNGWYQIEAIYRSGLIVGSNQSLSELLKLVSLLIIELDTREGN